MFQVFVAMKFRVCVGGKVFVCALQRALKTLSVAKIIPSRESFVTGFKRSYSCRPRYKYTTTFLFWDTKLGVKIST
jgi:hypothetical protein